MMRIIFPLFALIAAAFATSQMEDTATSVIKTMKMIYEQNHGGNVTEVYQLLNEIEQFTEEGGINLLMSSGLTEEIATLLVQIVLPLFEMEGRSYNEQVATLLVLSNQFCRHGKDKECQSMDNVFQFLTSVTSTNKFGCDIDADTKCYCTDQTDIFLWLNFFTPENKGDKFPVVAMDLLDKMPCSGMLGESEQYCECEQVTFGYDSIILETLKGYIDEAEMMSAVPSIRASIDIKNLLLQQMAASSGDNQLLSIIANMGTGASMTEQLKMAMLANMGLDATMTHLMLNGGKFYTDPVKNKNAMIQFLASQGSISPTFLPFLLKVDNAKEFFIYSMMDSGDIDPIQGLVMLSTMTGGVSNDALMEIIMATMNNPDSDAYLNSLFRPYAPTLPDGIFPGSRMYFAHFESLGINTCALHDLRNRYECGYIGISAEACEFEPYCCYSPIFITDDQVMAATNNELTSASAIPWCYYNVFFAFKDQFALEVANVGGFATPLQCPPLFKFGLQLDATLYTLAQSNAQIQKLVNMRTECGYPGITEFHCVAVRGCCWDSDAFYGVSQCYGKDTTAPNLVASAIIPTVFKAGNGTCDYNYFQIPMLYYQRQACHYPLQYFEYGFNILTVPTREDCLARLGCCYESSDAISEKYPAVPRCYSKMTTGVATTIPAFVDITARSGDPTEEDLINALHEKYGNK